MSGTKCREISQLDEKSLKELLDSFDTILCDCDGVLWRGNSKIFGSADLLNKLDSEKWGKKVIYITNNSTKTREENVDKLKLHGFPASMETIFHAGYLAGLYLKNAGFTGKVFVVGGKNAIQEELKEMGIDATSTTIDPVPEGWTLGSMNGSLDDLDPEVNCVIVGFDYNLSYWKILKAANYLQKKDAIFLATDRDSVFPIRSGLVIPGTGPLVTAIETAAEKQAINTGKPSPFAFEIIRKMHKEITPERTLMVGDRADSDILLGKNCGLKTLLVGSGINSVEEVRGWEKSGKFELVPDFFAKNLGELNEMMEKFGL